MKKLYYIKNLLTALMYYNKFKVLLKDKPLDNEDEIIFNVNIRKDNENYD